MRKEPPAFPFLPENAWFPFPQSTDGEGLVARGGNLSPGMLLSAYRQGVFPWFDHGEPLWWSPDPRFVVYPAELHVSESTRKIIRRADWRYSLDRSFEDVIESCARQRRPGQRGTWINEAMIEGYTTLHGLGYAHSVEVWEEGDLVGGLYGVSLGRMFFGESMFTRKANSSKAAFIALALTLGSHGFLLIDSQVPTVHMERLGGRNIPRSTYLELLREATEAPTRRGRWNFAFPEFPESAWAFDRGLVFNSGAVPGGLVLESAVADKLAED